MKISEILWKAANEYLDTSCFDASNACSAYSCIAALMAETDSSRWDVNANYGQLKRWSPTLRFLKELGVKVGGTTQFDKFSSPKERQGARYAWLMFASMIAEEEGL